MNYDHIREAAYKANMQLPQLGLVIFTFGNASAADRELGVFALSRAGFHMLNFRPQKW